MADSSSLSSITNSLLKNNHFLFNGPSVKIQYKTRFRAAIFFNNDALVMRVTSFILIAKTLTRYAYTYVSRLIRYWIKNAKNFPCLYYQYNSFSYHLHIRKEHNFITSTCKKSCLCCEHFECCLF